MLLFGNQYLILIIPIVVALFGWIAVVFWANIHPGVRHVGQPAADVRPTDVLAAGAADEDAEQPVSGPGSVPQPRQQATEPPPVPRPPEPARGDRSGSARGR
jgi:hypothetical protein